MGRSRCCDPTGAAPAIMRRNLVLRFRLGGAVAAAVGAALFGWALRHAGVETALEGVRRVGGGILVVFALGGVRALLRTGAWRMCVDRSQHVAFAPLLAAYLAGDAV